VRDPLNRTVDYPADTPGTLTGRAVPAVSATTRRRTSAISSRSAAGSSEGGPSADDVPEQYRAKAYQSESVASAEQKPGPVLKETQCTTT